MVVGWKFTPPSPPAWQPTKHHLDQPTPTSPDKENIFLWGFLEAKIRGWGWLNLMLLSLHLRNNWDCVTIWGNGVYFGLTLFVIVFWFLINSTVVLLKYSFKLVFMQLTLFIFWVEQNGKQAHIFLKKKKKSLAFIFPWKLLNTNPPRKKKKTSGFCFQSQPKCNNNNTKICTIS